MNEQLVNQLIEALNKQAATVEKQTEAISRLAESNDALCSVIMQALSEERDGVEITALDDLRPVYLSEKTTRR
jgi:hypothetical protein